MLPDLCNHTPTVQSHQAVALAFLKVINLMAPPPSVMRPEIALRVLLGNLRRLAPGRQATVEIEPGLRCGADPVLARSALER